MYKMSFTAETMDELLANIRGFVNMAAEPTPPATLVEPEPAKPARKKRAAKPKSDFEQQVAETLPEPTPEPEPTPADDIEALRETARGLLRAAQQDLGKGPTVEVMKPFVTDGEKTMLSNVADDQLAGLIDALTGALA